MSAEYVEPEIQSYIDDLLHEPSITASADVSLKSVASQREPKPTTAPRHKPPAPAQDLARQVLAKTLAKVPSIDERDISTEPVTTEPVVAKSTLIDPAVDPITPQQKEPLIFPANLPQASPPARAPIIAPTTPAAAEPALGANDDVLQSNDQADGVSDTRWLSNGRPNWAQQRFDCLLFCVNGLTLALPLVCLGSVQVLDSEQVRPLINQPPWMMGLFHLQNHNVRVIDSALMVMPEKYQADVRDGYHYLVSVGQQHWGLAIDSIDRTITLEPDDVRWRSQRTKRPWLAGTVVDHMCALMDVHALGQVIGSSKQVF